MADTEFSALSSTNTIASSDQLLIVRGGVAYRFSGTLPTLDASGNLGLGTAAANEKLEVASSSGGRAIISDAGGASRKVLLLQSPAPGSAYGQIRSYDYGAAAELPLVLQVGGGNLLIGVTSSPTGGHTISKNVTANAGNVVLSLQNSAENVAQFQSVTGGSLGNSANAALRINKDATTNRSISAPGTINASGADYAEYMTKAEGCGHIAKGQVCGVNAAGLLTLAWSEAIAFVVKSTDPNLVGGDNWDRHVGPRPEAPAPLRGEPAAPVAPEAFTEPTPEAEEDEDAATFSLRVALWNGRRLAAEAAAAEHAAALEAFAVAHADWEAERDAFDAAQAQYEADLPLWEEAHEAARQRVDRIAYSGQVPVIVTGDFAPGDYIVAAEGPDDTIVAVAVFGVAITFDQYRARIGKVLAVTEDDPEGRWPAGRAWVDVQHG